MCWELAIVAGGSANGDLKSFGPLTGEQTEVASANRAFRGVVLDAVLDSEFVLTVRDDVSGLFSFRSMVWKPTVLVLFGPLTMSTGDTGAN